MLTNAKGYDFIRIMPVDRFKPCVFSGLLGDASTHKPSTYLGSYVFNTLSKNRSVTLEFISGDRTICTCDKSPGFLSNIDVSMTTNTGEASLQFTGGEPHSEAAQGTIEAEDTDENCKLNDR